MNGTKAYVSFALDGETINGYVPFDVDQVWFPPRVGDRVELNVAPETCAPEYAVKLPHIDGGLVVPIKGTVKRVEHRFVETNHEDGHLWVQRVTIYVRSPKVKIKKNRRKSS